MHMRQKKRGLKFLQTQEICIPLHRMEYHFGHISLSVKLPTPIDRYIFKLYKHSHTCNMCISFPLLLTLLLSLTVHRAKNDIFFRHGLISDDVYLQLDNKILYNKHY